MPDQNGWLKSQNPHLPGLILLAICLSLPAINPEGFGWLVSFVPLPVFYYLTWLGKAAGMVLVRNAVLLSGGGALLFGSLPLYIFSVALVPIGFVFYQAAQQKYSPIKTCLHGMLYLGTACLVIWGITGLAIHANPYTALVSALNQALDAQTEILKTAELPVETQQKLQMAVLELKDLLPRILPAIMVSGILYTVWMNLVLGSWMLKKKDPALLPWQEYNEWRLPDSLVWGIIISGIAVLLPAPPLKIMGLNILMVWWAMYLLQGLAVLIFLLKRWSTPPLLQGVIYALIIVQTYGIILLSIIGLTDVWADFRKMNSEKETAENNNEPQG